MNCDEERARMIAEQLKGRGLSDERLLAAFQHVPRHLFVPEPERHLAYTDQALPIGEGQTISQPYMVALMLHCLRLSGHERVLEIGTGSGYQTVLLSELALEVYSVERLPRLLEEATQHLMALGCGNAHLTVGDGSLGWPEHAPYDAVIVSAAAPSIPSPLAAQLADGGRMALPVGTQQVQTLTLVEKHGESLSARELTQCTFIPLLGRYGWPPMPDASKD